MLTRAEADEVFANILDLKASAEEIETFLIALSGLTAASATKKKKDHKYDEAIREVLGKRTEDASDD